MPTSELVIVGTSSVEAVVLRRLLDIEGRGARFELKADGGFRVVPANKLTNEDCEFLRANRDEARRALDACERASRRPN